MCLLRNHDTVITLSSRAVPSCVSSWGVSAFKSTCMSGVKILESVCSFLREPMDLGPQFLACYWTKATLRSLTHRLIYMIPLFISKSSRERSESAEKDREKESPQFCCILFFNYQFEHIEQPFHSISCWEGQNCLAIWKTFLVHMIWQVLSNTRSYQFSKGPCKSLSGGFAPYHWTAPFSSDVYSSLNRWRILFCKWIA
jgi:hypothetical protein